MTRSSSTPILHLALEVDGAGAHPAASIVDPDAVAAALTGRGVQRVVSIAEAAGISFVTIDDTLLPPTFGPAARLDAVVRAAYVAPTTSRIGLVPLSHPAVVEPFHVAAQLAALDHASTGRAGWLVGSGPVPGAREALDRPVPDGDELIAETADVVSVVRDLWDSWEDDAVIRDTATGRYIDRDRLHYVDFVSGGEGNPAGPDLRDAPAGSRAPFTVKGPSIVPRGPQGQPLVIARAGVVPDELVDVVLVDGHVDGTTPARGEDGGPRVFLNLPVTFDTAQASAARRLADLDEQAETVTEGAGFAGPPEELIDLLRRLHGRVDGVRLLPALHSVDTSILVRDVLPALRVDRRTPTARPGQTLRDLIGLPRPANRYALAGGAR